MSKTDIKKDETRMKLDLYRLILQDYIAPSGGDDVLMVVSTTQLQERLGSSITVPHEMLEIILTEMGFRRTWMDGRLLWEVYMKM